MGGHLQARLEADLLPRGHRWLLAGDLSASCALGWRSQFLATWASPLTFWIPHNVTAGFPQSEECERERQKTDRGNMAEDAVFYNLRLQVTHHYVCRILWPHRPTLVPCVCWCLTTHRCELQEAVIVQGHFEGWLPGSGGKPDDMDGYPSLLAGSRWGAKYRWSEVLSAKRSLDGVQGPLLTPTAPGNLCSVPPRVSSLDHHTGFPCPFMASILWRNRKDPALPQ